MKILVTGGTGYIGSITAVELINVGHEVVIVDNLSNSTAEVIDRIEQITKTRPKFYKTDLRDEFETEEIFAENHIDAVMHFAGFKAVGESVAEPLKYYENNIGSTISLLKAMKRHNVKTLVFSSSATVYGIPEHCPIDESFPRCAINPYGSTKLIIEDMLIDLFNSDKSYNIALLRYFNPLGAHESRLLGETPTGIPNNLMPYITQVAAGKLAKLSVFGNDYPTPDGTAVRDYIHVVDLAKGHIAALNKLQTGCGLFACNLGTGKGYSVMEIIHAFEKVNNLKIPYVIAPRRAGDAVAVYASTKKAENELGFKVQKTLEDMCRDAWEWQKKIK